MTKNNLEDLMGALEAIRSEKYPEVPKDLLIALLAVEYENQDYRAGAQSKSFKLLDDFLNKHIEE